MNKRVYMIAGTVVLLSTLSMGAVAYLQGDFKDLLSGQSAQTVSESVKIKLSGNTATADSAAVQVENSAVTITAGGQYDISGEANEVTITVSAEVKEDVTIRLNNASFASLNLQSTGTNVVNLTSGSANTLGGGESGITATNVTVTGEGTLQVTDVEKYGIFATDDLVVESGAIQITSAGSGLYTKHETDSTHGNLTINGGTFSITAGQTQGNAALFAANQLTINNGTLTVANAYEGYVGKHLLLNGGSADITAAYAGLASRDSFSAEGQTSETDITVNGGTNTVRAGNNPLLANGNITIAGGVNTLMSTSPDQPVLNYTGTATLTGGTMWAFGTVSLTTASQNLLTANLLGNAGDTITITDASGKEAATMAAPVAFSSVSYTAASLTAGEMYYLSTTSGSYSQAVATTTGTFSSGTE